jgi:hypothetical protein
MQRLSPLVKIQMFLRFMFSRSSLANIMMLFFIVFTSIGSGMIFLPAGFIAAGIGCGVFGYLLGSE